MSLHLNDTFLEEPWAFFVSERKTVIVIFDTGASLAITHSIEDFVKPPQALDRPLFLGGMTDGLEVSGIGKLAWTFEACDKSEIQIITDRYYVPNDKARFLSPQRVFNNSRKSADSTKGVGSSIHYAWKDFLQLIFPIIDLVGFLLQLLFQENVHLLCIFLC